MTTTPAPTIAQLAAKTLAESGFTQLAGQELSLLVGGRVYVVEVAAWDVTHSPEYAHLLGADDERVGGAPAQVGRDECAAALYTSSQGPDWTRARASDAPKDLASVAAAYMRADQLLASDAPATVVPSLPTEAIIIRGASTRLPGRRQVPRIDLP